MESSGEQHSTGVLCVGVGLTGVSGDLITALSSEGQEVYTRAPINKAAETHDEDDNVDVMNINVCVSCQSLLCGV